MSLKSPWLILAAFMLAAAAHAQSGASATAAQHGRDFDALWGAIDQGYAYFEPRQRAAWRRARSALRARAVRAGSRDRFVAALESALARLRDDHVTLSERSSTAPRRVPDETDIWPAWKDGRAVVEAVRTFGDADVAGMKPGQVLRRVDGVPVERALRDTVGAAASEPAAREWALRHLLAGPRQGVLRVQVAEAGKLQELEIARGGANGGNGPPFIARRMGEERDLGYIRLKAEAGARAAEHFEAALGPLRGTRALIVDLREYPGPPTRAATERILALFAAEPTPWQLREAPARQQRVADTVAPAGGTPYRAPVLVLVDRWTAGEGEALAAGLTAVANAKLVGTPMAGLRGEAREIALPHSGIVLRFPAQRTFHVDGTPREALRPALAVDLAAPSGGPGDPILYQALKALEGKG